MFRRHGSTIGKPARARLPSVLLTHELRVRLQASDSPAVIGLLILEHLILVLRSATHRGSILFEDQVEVMHDFIAMSLHFFMKLGFPVHQVFSK